VGDYGLRLKNHVQYPLELQRDRRPALGAAELLRSARLRPIDKGLAERNHDHEARLPRRGAGSIGVSAVRNPVRGFQFFEQEAVAKPA